MVLGAIVISTVWVSEYLVIGLSIIHQLFCENLVLAIGDCGKVMRIGS